MIEYKYGRGKEWSNREKSIFLVTCSGISPDPEEDVELFNSFKKDLGGILKKHIPKSRVQINESQIDPYTGLKKYEIQTNLAQKGIENTIDKEITSHSEKLDLYCYLDNAYDKIINVRTI